MIQNRRQKLIGFVREHEPCHCDDGYEGEDICSTCDGDQVVPVYEAVMVNV